jgi:hypothetical protein
VILFVTDLYLHMLMKPPLQILSTLTSEYILQAQVNEAASLKSRQPVEVGD